MCYGTENECAKCVYKFENGKNKSNLLFCLGMNFNFVARTIYIPFQMSHNIQYPIKVWKTIHNTGTRSFSHSIKWTIIYFFRMFVHCLIHFLCPVSLSVILTFIHHHYHHSSRFSICWSHSIIHTEPTNCILLAFYLRHYWH